MTDTRAKMFMQNEGDDRVFTLAKLEECAAKVKALGPIPRLYETPFAPPTGGLLIDGVMYVSPLQMHELGGRTP
jgi:hypothetical protein